MEQKLYKSNSLKSDFYLSMAYPACEAFALSSLGYLWLYKLADEFNGINVEKIYTEAPIINKKSNAISFSMSFDFDFMGVFEILEKNKLNFFAKDRCKADPLIFAGGPVITTNPEPYKKFFDFMIIGDGENLFIKILEILKLNLSKEETLTKLSKLEGVYIPYNSTKVKKVTENLETVIYTPILSEKSYFKNTFIIEVARGCMNRCAFCTASYLNLPFRNYEYSKIIEAIDLGLKYTNKIALLGAQLSAHPDFDKIITYIKNKIEQGKEIELGISSLRTDSINPELIKALVIGGQKTSTIAIEAANERLRKLINKNLKEDQILDAIKICRENGLKGLKIYSMIGIPTETQSDIEDFITLAKKIKEQNKGFEITFSFSSFVPKPQTPLQWAERESTKSLEKKQKYLEKEFAKIGVGFRFSSIKWDFWQTLLSRGNDNLSEYLVQIYKNGGKNGAYKAEYKNMSKDLLKAITGYRLDEDLAWDFIEGAISKQLLINEHNRLFTKFSNSC